MSIHGFSRAHLCLVVVVLYSSRALSLGLSTPSKRSNDVPNTNNRREFLIGGSTVTTLTLAGPTLGTFLLPSLANAQVLSAPDDIVVDMEKINSIRSAGRLPPSSTVVGITTNPDPPPTLVIRNPTSSNGVVCTIPRIGYSFYKTPLEQVERCTRLALRAGIRQFDIATDYGSNSEFAKALASYLNVGMTGLDFSTETQEVSDRLDAANVAGEQHTASIMGRGGESSLSPAPMGSAGRRGRREGLFIHHKISNQEQSTDPVAVRRSVKKAIAELGCLYLDMVSIHSPLTDKARRLTGYQALLDLRDSGFIKSVGVCNYGVAPLQEIANAGLELPAINQLELSPFNAHKDVVDWCTQNGVAISCSAWSRLSSADGPTQGWDELAKLAQQKGMTKAQVLIRWALQKGYVCSPRSSSASKVERIAIAENSYGGINLNTQSTFVLSPEEMQFLDSLDVSYAAGKLGRRDGWSDTDVAGPEWDPTSSV